MFGSTVLEVVIGLVFLYLSLSLVCSALNEYYSALLSRRAKHLRDSLYTIFNKDDPKGLAFLLEFYTHPLISGLSPSRKAAGPPPSLNLTPALPWYQLAVVLPARLVTDLAGLVAGWYGLASRTLQWVADAIRDPYGVGGVMAGLRKELAITARETPVYIPDRAFSGAIFAVLASDSGAIRRIQVELNDQLAGINQTFQALADPKAAADLTARVGEIGLVLRDAVEAAQSPVELAKVADAQLKGLLAGIPESDPSYAPAVALIAAQIAAIAPPAGATAGAAGRAQIDVIRKALIEKAGVLADAAGASVEGAAKRELIRLAGQSAWFSSVRKAPEAGPYLKGLKDALDAREAAREETRKLVVAASEAVGKAGPQVPPDTKVRDHIWDTLQASLQKLGAAFATMDRGSPLRERLVAQVQEAMEKIGPAKAEPPMSLEQAQMFATGILKSFRGTLVALSNQVEAAKASGWVEQEEALILAAGSDLITIAKLRDAVAALPASDLRAALLSLMDEVGDDLDKVKQNIQVWYNDSMERVSGWYKRNTQVILSMIAILLAGTMNADTIAVAEKLWADSTLRANVNALAKSADPATLISTPAANSGQKGADWTTATKDLLNKTGLPLGWDEQQLKDLGFGRAGLDLLRAGQIPKWDQSKAEALLRKLLGLVLTAIAVSMGAPFWFDVLNKLVNVRTAGLQPQKTAEKPTVAPPMTA